MGEPRKYKRKYKTLEEAKEANRVKTRERQKLNRLFPRPPQPQFIWMPAASELRKMTSTTSIATIITRCKQQQSQNQDQIFPLIPPQQPLPPSSPTANVLSVNQVYSREAMTKLQLVGNLLSYKGLIRIIG